MYPQYGIVGKSVESKLRLELAEDAVLGPQPGENGYALMCDEVAVVQSMCQKLAHQTGDALLTSQASGIPEVRAKGEQLEQWECRMSAEKQVEDNGDIVLTTMCEEDCYLRTFVAKEPTMAPLAKIAAVVTEAFKDKY
jgi:hypothetical protein